MIYSFDKHVGQQQRDSMGEFLKILNQEFHMHWLLPSGDFLGDFYIAPRCDIVHCQCNESPIWKDRNDKKV